MADYNYEEIYGRCCTNSDDAESKRLLDEKLRLPSSNWKRWGPYLADRQWATVREDYSADGDAWYYFPHDHSRSRAYRWGEDGLLGITDRECRLCFSIALWNGKDSILKERLFGLTGKEGNHGEDVKELYYFLESTPTHSYMRALYKYPMEAFPYETLVKENMKRTREEPEFELMDTGIFNNGQYWDVEVEYAKNTPNDILIRLNVFNRSNELNSICVLPTVWFRNTWSWGCMHEGCDPKPSIEADSRRKDRLHCKHRTLGTFRFDMESMTTWNFEENSASPMFLAEEPEWLFTENESNHEKLWCIANSSPFVKDSFHEYVVHGNKSCVNPKRTGTKAAAYHILRVPSHSSATLRMRLFSTENDIDKCLDEEHERFSFGEEFERIFQERKKECDLFYRNVLSWTLTPEEKEISIQAFASLLWSKQFYYYVVEDWLKGDPDMPAPPTSRWHGRNIDWTHLFSKDIFIMPDKWEYPWFASWDCAFHCVSIALIDIEFAKHQLQLFLREWYMHPNGCIPACEFNFSDVNPPVHAWATWRVYKMSGPPGKRDRLFLSRVFQKLLINFTWWVNRKDISGKHIFAGGFLGLDNIGIFDRSQPLPNGSYLEQADGTSWMAFFVLYMLKISLELAKQDPSYEDIASKFFEHFISIATAINRIGGTGLYDKDSGFYYDHLKFETHSQALKIRSLVGLVPFFAVGNLPSNLMDHLEGFKKRTKWFLEHKKQLARHISLLQLSQEGQEKLYLLAIPNRQVTEGVLPFLFDEKEFLSKYGIRSLSRFHLENPFCFLFDGVTYRVQYLPGESNSALFGGNSNWRGPIWFCMNYLLIQSLERLYNFYGDSLKVRMDGAQKPMNLREVAYELKTRLVKLFLPDANGVRPCYGSDSPLYSTDPNFKNLVLFYEYFHGDTGKGLGASHQTGWTSLVANCLFEIGKQREKAQMRSS